jgi:hypothetical protein
VVVGVEILALFSGNDAARAAVATPGCLDGVFPVIAACLDGQALFEIAEDDAVPVVGEGAAFLDQGQRLPCFPGLDGDGVDNPWSRLKANALPTASQRTRRKRSQIGIGMT